MLQACLEIYVQGGQFGSHRVLVLHGLEELATANAGPAGPDKSSCLALAVQCLTGTRGARKDAPLWPKELEG